MTLLGDESFEDFHELVSWESYKAGVITQEMQRKCAKQIRKYEALSWKSLRAIWITAPSVSSINVLSSLDLGALITLRALGFLLSRWTRTVISPSLRLDGSVGVSRKNMAGSNKLILPQLHCMFLRLVCRQAASCLRDLLHLDLKTAFLQGVNYNLSRARAVIVQLPSDLGLPPYLVGYCVRPVYCLHDAFRSWWLDKFTSLSIGPY